MSKLRFWIFLLLFDTPLGAFAAPTCPSGEHWVEPYFRRAHTRHDGTRVSATKVKGHCRKNPRGYEQWHQRLSNSRPRIWGYEKESSKRWTVEEIQRLLDAISVLPDQIISLDQAKIYRMLKSQNGQNPATTNPPQSDITLYDLAFTHKDSLAQILCHELSHILFASLKPAEKKEFGEKAGWSSKNILGKEYHSPKIGKPNIKSDSMDSLEEDFANHIELFLFKPDTVKDISKESYDWIRNRFGKDFKLKEGL